MERNNKKVGNGPTNKLEDEKDDTLIVVTAEPLVSNEVSINVSFNFN